MEKSVFKAKMIPRYLDEIFGESDKLEDRAEALMFKVIPQKTKYHLRKIADFLLQKQSELVKEAKELKNNYNNQIEEAKTRGEEIKEGENSSYDIEFFKKNQELEDRNIELNHIPFEETDFVDGRTEKVVGGKMYYNIIDLLLYKEA